MLHSEQFMKRCDLKSCNVFLFTQVSRFLVISNEYQT